MGAVVRVWVLLTTIYGDATSSGTVSFLFDEYLSAEELV